MVMEIYLVLYLMEECLALQIMDLLKMRLLILLEVYFKHQVIPLVIMVLILVIHHNLKQTQSLVLLYQE